MGSKSQSSVVPSCIWCPASAPSWDWPLCLSFPILRDGESGLPEGGCDRWGYDKGMASRGRWPLSGQLGPQAGETSGLAGAKRPCESAVARPSLTDGSRCVPGRPLGSHGGSGQQSLKHL